MVKYVIMPAKHEIENRLKEKPEPYIGRYCEFQPVGWVDLGEARCPIGFKVVTENLRSLGLRKNPNILTFIQRKWTVLPEDQILPGISDWGGIWSAHRLSRARGIQKYLEEKYKKKTRCFVAGLKDPLYANHYRIKAAGIILLEELDSDFLYPDK